MNEDYTVAELVALGVILLDSKGPADWRELIDVNDLDMVSIHSCVLGQVFGSFEAGCYALDISVYEASNYGFDMSPFADMVEFDHEWTNAVIG